MSLQVKPIYQTVVCIPIKAVITEFHIISGEYFRYRINDNSSFNPTNHSISGHFIKIGCCFSRGLGDFTCFDSFKNNIRICCGVYFTPNNFCGASKLKYRPRITACRRIICHIIPRFYLIKIELAIVLLPIFIIAVTTVIWLTRTPVGKFVGE